MKDYLQQLWRRVSDAIAIRWIMARRFWHWKHAPRRAKRERERREEWARRNRFMYIGPVPRQQSKVADRDSVSVSGNILSRR